VLPLLNKRVLVVDDEPSIRDLVAEALSEAGFEVEVASNGVEALTLMQHWLPDAIVLDLMMPRLDGTGLTELMRLSPRLASVPVLLVTAAYGAEAAARQVGATAWLSKPFELDHLVAMVAQLAGSPASPPSFSLACEPLGPTNLPPSSP
jgi:two-component system, chemotaxis family, chemotaxis protein CheY